MKTENILSEADFEPFVRFIAALPEPDAELAALAKEARDATRAYAEVVSRRDGVHIGAAAAHWVRANLLFLRGLAIVARRERQRIDSERAEFQRQSPASVARRDYYRCMNNSDADGMKLNDQAAQKFAEAVEPYYAKIAAASQALELAGACSLRYGSRLGADLQFFPLLETAMEAAAAKAEKAMR